MVWKDHQKEPHMPWEHYSAFLHYRHAEVVAQDLKGQIEALKDTNPEIYLDLMIKYVNMKANLAVLGHLCEDDCPEVVQVHEELREYKAWRANPDFEKYN
jgi:hypothetical protein